MVVVLTHSVMLIQMPERRGASGWNRFLEMFQFVGTTPTLNLLLCNLCSFYDIKVFQELFSFWSGIGSLDYVVIQCSLFYFISYLVLSNKVQGPALFVCCGNGDLALTRQSVMPLLYSTRPVDQIYRASVVPSLLGKTEDKEMTEM